MKTLERQRAELVMRRRGWLAQLPRAFQDAVLSKCDLIRLKANQIVYEVGDEAGGLFGVVEGHVGLHLAVRGMQPSLAFVGGPGLWVGETAAVRGHARLITVIAKTRCKVVRLRRAELMLLARLDPLAWPYVALCMGRSVERCINVIDALKRSDPIDRVAAMLLTLLDDEPAATAVITASQADLAAMTSLGRGSVNAALAELQARRLIRRGYRVIDVLSTSGLSRFCGRASRGTVRTAAA